VKKKTTSDQVPGFVSFELYRSPRGPILYALDTRGRLWEKWPDRPWGSVPTGAVTAHGRARSLDTDGKRSTDNGPGVRRKETIR